MLLNFCSSPSTILSSVESSGVESLIIDICYHFGFLSTIFWFVHEKMKLSKGEAKRCFTINV